jgi:O-antigen/teichoic acid export membrane protein
MPRWTGWKVFVLGAAYVALYIGLSLALLLLWVARHRQSDGQWHFFWLVPITYVHNYLVGLLLPPLLLVVAWVVAKVRRSRHRAAV